MTDRRVGAQSGGVEALAAAPVSDDAQPRDRLGQLYREHADFVWRVLLRFGIDDAHAEDVAHDVFLVVGRRLNDYDETTPFRGWLYGIARGVAANVRRSRERSQRRLSVVQPPPEPPTPEEQAHRTQAAMLVEQFLDTLPAAQREVFVLVDIEGMSGPEAAAALRDNLNSVYSRLRLARTRFRSFVAKTTASPRQESAS